MFLFAYAFPCFQTKLDKKHLEFIINQDILKNKFNFLINDIYDLGSGLVFIMYSFLNDRTRNRPLLWLLVSRQLSLAQQYLGRVNREVAFRSPAA